MSDVWVCVPSKRPAEHVRKWAAAWRERGYKIALWVDRISGHDLDCADCWGGCDDYPGYAVATNKLIQHVVKDRGARWCVIGGDDVYPDPNHTASEIAQQCEAHFGLIGALMETTVNYWRVMTGDEHSTFGVMQPTGDRWQEGMGGFDNAPIDRICGSAWLGREFCERINGGRGPLWPEFTHMHVDEALQCVAEKLGILWQRRDLTQLHNHWARGDGKTRADMPEFLAEANSAAHWQKSLGILERLKAEGFKQYLEMK